MVEDPEKYLRKLHNDRRRESGAMHKYNKKYYLDNKEREKERHRKYVELNRDRINAYNKAWRKKQKTTV